MVKNEVNSILEFDILLLLSHDTVSSGDQWLGVCAPGSVYSVCMGNKLTIDEAWIQEFVLVFYVTHTHTPRYLQSQNYCSIPHYFIHMKTGEFTQLLYNATLHGVNQYVTVQAVFLNTMEVTVQSSI